CVETDMHKDLEPARFDRDGVPRAVHLNDAAVTGCKKRLAGGIDRDTVADRALSKYRLRPLIQRDEPAGEGREQGDHCRITPARSSARGISGFIMNQFQTWPGRRFSAL